ncbi:hypothetical protein ISF_09403 [Cordyceps fumosorosea ARSEF 2679]|uniref:Uncharacterized protein n=1 Tax=Cordyceps fumosorosea (strain ARSEF 2679) TaxID=1081104 RepID=A0A162M2Q5_CORFA|nr:hypothetical protein ISF_09403 [Cordyceps fumosorosea ARSEF 2679]OAA49700.1 hypothetical protein ISF_09403 [Cordyceps fumosorosea ARSEF 2679]
MAVAVEDLPQMWQRPSFEALVAALAGLELGPAIWARRLQGQTAAMRSAESRYLASVVRSPLTWLTDDAQREAVWAAAARCVSERCGRMAVGDLVRRWLFAPPDAAAGESFELVIREPAVAGAAGLGFKTWASAYVLARELPRLSASSALFPLFDESLGQSPPAVLELGAGTGLLGLAAAALWAAPVTLSDLPDVVHNLRHNVAANERVVAARGGLVRVGCLTWGGEEDAARSDQELFGQPFQFPIVLAADALYNDDHPELLASAISRNLALGPEARALIMSPMRDNVTLHLIDKFKQMMLDLKPPLVCEEEDEFVGNDDWAGADDEDDEEKANSGNVRCWLGIFSRGGSPLTNGKALAKDFASCYKTSTTSRSR